MVKVSILMNGYNAQAYLREAIDSVYAQSFSDWEIIFIDNCSTDNTKEIVKSYDDRIKYYKTEKNIPLGAARNFGLKYCRGEYLAFLDTDDIWLEDKLEIQVKAMDKHKEFVLCYGGLIYIDSYGKDIGGFLPKAKSGNVFSQQLRRYEINMLAVLIRNNGNIVFNETLRHSPDYNLFMQILSKEKACIIPMHIVKYRKLENSLTSKNIDVWWVEMRTTLDKIFFEDKTLKERYKKEHDQAYAKVAYYKAQYLLSINKKQEAIKELSKYKMVRIDYMLLYLLSLLPQVFWDMIHKKY